MTTTLSRTNRADFLSHGVCEGWTVLYGLVTASTTQASSERDSTRQHGQVHNNRLTMPRYMGIRLHVDRCGHKRLGLTRGIIIAVARTVGLPKLQASLN